MRPYRLAAAFAAALLAAVTGCVTASSSPEDSPTVVASFYPWAWLSRQIAGGDMQVKDLTGSGADPHGVELTARQLVEVRQASLVVYVKGIQPAVDDAVAQHAADHGFDAGSVVEVLPAAEATGTEPDAERHRSGNDGNGDEHAAFDPHIWLDPVRYAVVAEKLGERLARVDPPRAAAYRERTERLVRTLGELDEEYRTGLRICRSRAVVTSHASFGYLADRYDLEQVGIAGLDPDVPPSPARLTAVARLAEAKNVDVIFLERLASPEVARTLAREVGARTAVLDTVASRQPDSSGDYLSLMRDNLSVLRTALGCS